MTFRKRCLAAFLLTANAVLVVSACAPHRSASPGRTCKTGLAKPGKVLVRYTVEGGAKTADAGQGLGDDVMTDRYREVIVFRDGRLIVRDGLRTGRILRLPARQLAAIGGDLERACFPRLRRA
jgi:hypothetical protein